MQKCCDKMRLYMPRTLNDVLCKNDNQFRYRILVMLKKTYELYLCNNVRLISSVVYYLYVKQFSIFIGNLSYVVGI